MPTKEKSTYTDQTVPMGKIESFIHAQQVHACHPDQDGKPDQPCVLLLEENKTDNRYQKDI